MFFHQEAHNIQVSFVDVSSHVLNPLLLSEFANCSLQLLERNSYEIILSCCIACNFMLVENNSNKSALSSHP